MAKKAKEISETKKEESMVATGSPSGLTGKPVPPCPLRFTSPYRRYRAVLKPPVKKMVGEDVVITQGITMKFEDWACTLNDPEAIKLAIDSGYYGKDFIAPEWEKMRGEQR